MGVDPFKRQASLKFSVRHLKINKDVGVEIFPYIYNIALT